MLSGFHSLRPLRQLASVRSEYPVYAEASFGEIGAIGERMIESGMDTSFLIESIWVFW
nr:MAG TPA: hypothetical protein [Caudoviricetes sp.]